MTTLETKLTAAYNSGEPGNHQMGMDPIAIITIIASIAKALMAACPTPAPALKTSVEAGDRDTLDLLHYRVRREMRMRYGLLGYYRFDGAKVERTILAAVKDSASAEIAEEMKAAKVLFASIEDI